ncbi:KinB-signaling pathway activation protein [Bacillus sp. AFS077874]|uniref:KinB-signaling pathway activation protein n=1 Tax=unclassified Bacillus (in: firmicutes) TaxID=185979 RepID=UPI000BEC776D|nr:MULTISPECIES: KinB-signaling pathway activation protein [unclassified Bacillus (in: firmicutes)]PEC48279.1 KinB-signaling pathway activation protein [Bacillus sp. AFS096315]PFM75046.1 KinB-signaling pathway activation protein [Bacillus sp. AFS077874]
MTSRKLVRLFLTTLLVGGIATILTGILYGYKEYFGYVQDGRFIKLLVEVSFLFILGLVFSAVSQMGFFAYLTIHRFGLGLFKSLWNTVQIVLIILALFDLAYFRFKEYAHGEAFTVYLIFPIVLLVGSLIVSYIKMKETNKGAFIPALFFMIVVTIVEWVPALRQNDLSWLILMLVPLFICNAYQLLTLHKILKS